MILKRPTTKDTLFALLVVNMFERYDYKNIERGKMLDFSEVAD